MNYQFQSGIPALQGHVTLGHLGYGQLMKTDAFYIDFLLVSTIPKPEN